MSIKDRAKKHSVSLALFSMLSAGFVAYSKHQETVQLQMKERHDRYEEYISDWQDKVECKLDSMKTKTCK